MQHSGCQRPLILASMAGLLCERSGIINIGLEGKMLGSAFAAAAVASLTGSVWLGMLSAMTLGVILALLHGLACITYRGDQIISGVAINMLMSGFTVLMSLAILFQHLVRPPNFQEKLALTQSDFHLQKFLVRFPSLVLSTKKSFLGIPSQFMRLFFRLA